MHRVVTRAIAARYHGTARALGVKKPRTGSIGVVHRFSSDSKCNVHLHDLWLDGVYGLGDAFTPIAPPDRAEMAKLLAVIVKRIARLFSRRSEGTDGIDEPALATATDRAVRGNGVTRHGPEREDDHDTRDAACKIKARLEGFDLDATTVVAPEKRDRLEHLCRYLLRPPLAEARLRRLDTGEIALRLKTPYSDGTEWITMSPTTFLERLCTLVPRPGKNTIVHSGVLSAHAKDRALIVPGGADTTRVHDSSWAELSKHGIGVDVLACSCGGRMRFIEIVIERDRLRPLLDAHGYRKDPLPMAKARAPPQSELDFGA